MIKITVKCNDEAERDELRDKFCSALVASPAYVDSEIAVCDGDDSDEFILAVGECNSDDIAFELSGSDIELQ